MLLGSFLKSSAVWAQANGLGPWREEATVRFGGGEGGGIQKSSYSEPPEETWRLAKARPPQPLGPPDETLARPGHEEPSLFMTTALGRERPAFPSCGPGPRHRSEFPGNLCPSPLRRIWGTFGKGSCVASGRRVAQADSGPRAALTTCQRVDGRAPGVLLWERGIIVTG